MTPSPDGSIARAGVLSFPNSRTEDLPQPLLPIREDLPYVPRHHQPVRQGSEGDGVADEVAADRAVAVLLEGVLVDPEAVGSPELLVDEAVGGLPDRDPGAPAQRDAANADAVVDQRPRAHLDRPRGEDLEAEKGRGHLLQVPGVGEEGEDLGARPGDPGPRAELEDSHRAPAARKAARISSIRFRFTPKSLRPRREAERNSIRLAASSKTNSTSSTKW